MYSAYSSLLGRELGLALGTPLGIALTSEPGVLVDVE
jgi:hypothetical protein